MRTLIVIAFIGLSAQLIDGGLGMGYGVVSSTLLLVAGLSPAAASASVHLAEIGTTLASGISHWRFGNVDWRVVTRIALPGAVGAFFGATFLVSLPADDAKPWTSGILFVLGGYILVRFSRHRDTSVRPDARPRGRYLAPLGLVAGAVDATGGGGWGPVATPTLLASRTMEPKKIIGSVSASEFAVAVAASIGFLTGLSNSAIVWPIVVALLIGGVVAAPLAAWLVRKLPTHLLGVAVGGIILATNGNTILETFSAPSSMYITVFAAIMLAWVSALIVMIRGRPAATQESEPEKSTV